MADINSETVRQPSVYEEIKHVYVNEEVGKSFANFKLENAAKYVQDKKSQTDYFKNQFKEFVSGLQRPTVEASKHANKTKNRYQTIFPYDDNRVVLEVQNDDPSSSYINASYIKGLDSSTNYIAAQSPIKTTVVDFWRMVWEHDVGQIVMLTNTQTGEYWPNMKGKTATYGDITVKMDDKDVYCDFTIRQFSVTKEGSSDRRRVIQYHFTAWPEQSVPEYASSLAEFRRKVAKTSISSNGPIIVHCSNGIGRTGTFIALDTIMEDVKRSGEADVVSCIRHLREQRVNMVETEEQFTFLHDVLIEEHDCEMAVTADNFQTRYRELQNINPNTGKQFLENVFEDLQKTSPGFGYDYYENCDPETNMHSPQDASGGIKSARALNAVYLPGYKDSHAFIVMKTPAPATLIHFLDFIIERKVQCVVMLNKSVNEECGIYWPLTGDCLQVNENCTVKMLEEASANGIKRSKLKIINAKKTHVFTHLRVMNWPDNQHVPEDPFLPLRTLEYVDLIQRGKSRLPIILHCRNGSDKCGLLCSAFNIIDRMKFEQEVVIQHVIKQMRSRRLQIITNLEQFNFCYKVISVYLNEHQTDSNST